ncbi:hypothetical protein M5E87_21490 [Flavonifractor plautii]|nr:hypothetical protein M5E87_21490 [Flavonifractor plautii]
MNKAKKPEIRFKGFSDKWKKYKLGEVTTSYSGGTPAVGITEYYNGRIPFIRSAEVNRNYTELFITQKDWITHLQNWFQKAIFSMHYMGQLAERLGVQD